MYRQVLLVILVVGVLAAVLIPFVNRPTLWFGLPSLLVWCIAGVLLLTPALALVEYGRRHADEDKDG